MEVAPKRFLYSEFFPPPGDMTPICRSPASEEDSEEELRARELFESETMKIPTHRFGGFDVGGRAGVATATTWREPLPGRRCCVEEDAAAEEGPALTAGREWACIFGAREKEEKEGMKNEIEMLGSLARHGQRPRRRRKRVKPSTRAFSQSSVHQFKRSRSRPPSAGLLLFTTRTQPSTMGASPSPSAPPMTAAAASAGGANATFDVRRAAANTSSSASGKPPLLPANARLAVAPPPPPYASQPPSTPVQAAGGGRRNRRRTIRERCG